MAAQAAAAAAAFQSVCPTVLHKHKLCKKSLSVVYMNTTGRFERVSGLLKAWPFTVEKPSCHDTVLHCSDPFNVTVVGRYQLQDPSRFCAPCKQRDHQKGAC
jgi:hypothetical protein